MAETAVWPFDGRSTLPWADLLAVMEAREGTSFLKFAATLEPWLTFGISRPLRPKTVETGRVPSDTAVTVRIFWFPFPRERL
jgi:hypothetical protein